MNEKQTIKGPLSPSYQNGTGPEQKSANAVASSNTREAAKPVRSAGNLHAGKQQWMCVGQDYSINQVVNVSEKETFRDRTNHSYRPQRHLYRGTSRGPCQRICRVGDPAQGRCPQGTPQRIFWRQSPVGPAPILWYDLGRAGPVFFRKGKRTWDDL